MKDRVVKEIKNIVSLLLIVLMCLTVFSACGGNNDNGSDSKTSEKNIKKLFDEPVTFSVMTYEHPSNKYDINALKFKLIEKYTNVRFDFNITPQSSYTSKKTGALVSGAMCDFTYVIQSDIANYADKGIFLKLDDYMDDGLSNLKNKLKDDPIWKMVGYNGSVYALPLMMYAKNSGGNYGGIMPIIRTDLLEKNNIAVPATFDEWFNVMKKLKSIYPNSTPFSGRRSGMGLLYYMEYSMGCPYNMSYNYGKGKYVIGALTDEYKSIVEFWKKCYSEGILDPNWKSVNSNSWDEGINSNKILFWFDNAAFSTSQTGTLQKTDPDAMMTAIPLMANSKGEKIGISYDPTYNDGYAVNAKSDKTEQIIKFANWMYSEEGFRICNYGEEGVNYTLDDDGNVVLDEDFVKQYAKETDPVAAYNNANGFGVSFFTLASDNYQVPLLKAIGAKESLGILDEVFAEDYNAGYYKPEMPAVHLPSDIATQILVKKKNVENLLNKEIPKFIEGQRPMTEWNRFVSDLKNAGAQEVVNAYNDALAKVK